MYVIVWEFAVSAERVAEFRAAYGGDGVWAKLFSRGEGFSGTELLQARDGPAGFLTRDR